MTKLGSGLPWKSNEQQDQINALEKQSKDHFEQFNENAGSGSIGINWSFIQRVANMQAALTTLSALFIVTSETLTGFYVIFATLTTYLIFSAYTGVHAGQKQSYPLAIAYCGMCTFQTLIFVFGLCYCFFSTFLLDPDFRYYGFDSFTDVMNNEAIGRIHKGWNKDIIAALILGGVLCNIGTFVTGILGLTGCCRGFGRLLHAQEKMILDNQTVFLGVYDKVQRKNTF